MTHIKLILISFTMLALAVSAVPVSAKDNVLNKGKTDKKEEKSEERKEEKSQMNVFEILKSAGAAAVLNVTGTTTTNTGTGSSTSTSTTPTTPPQTSTTTPVTPTSTTTQPVATTTPVAGSTNTGLPIPSATPTSSFYEVTPAPLPSSEPAQPQSFFAGNYYGRAGFNESTTRLLLALGFLCGILGVGLVGGRALTARSL